VGDRPDLAASGELAGSGQRRALRRRLPGRAREQVGDGPAFLSFDIDVLDPGFAPGTGTPEVGGLLPHEALAFVRSLAGLDFRAFDVVEVSPQLDGPAQMTAMLAANVAHEMLGLRLLGPANP